MTALQTVRRAQGIIGFAITVRAILVGMTVTLLVAALIGFASLLTTGPMTGPFMPATSLLSGVVAIVVVLWRARGVVSSDQVALWIEQRMPQLQYALLTRVEQPRNENAAAMDAIVARQNVLRETIYATGRPLLMAIIAFVVVAVIENWSPSGPMGHYGPDRSHAVLYGPTPTVSRLEGIEARVSPPAYTGQHATMLRDPVSITALAGSGIVIRGKGVPIGITSVADHPLIVAQSADGWSVSLPMPSQPAALRLTDYGYERVIVLAPQADEIPRVTLSSPAHDTALRTPRLVVQLNASATDDIGLQQGHFEYLITSGAGEIFKSRTITTPILRFDGSRGATLTASLDLASLNLVEGDVISMRAIVQDGNMLTGPGVGTSETRTIRIIRASEYDSLAIEAAAPPPVDSSAISQRMLVIMTEKLVREAPRLARTDVAKQSSDIGELEDRIRRRVGEILSNEETGGEPTQPTDSLPTLEESESPEGNGLVNADLHAAYNALWQAVRSLKIAEPKAALPPMRVALAALDRARLANRLYLRGAPAKIIVDLKRVRLSAKEKGNSNTRTPRSFADSTRVRLSTRFESALGLIDKDPAHALTELSLLRVDALTALPEFAAAVGDATQAIRTRRDATLALLRARRLLDGPPRVTPALTPWSGGG